MRRLCLTVLTLTFGILMSSACEKYKPSYQVPKSSNQGRGTTPGTGPGPNPGPGGVPASDTNTDILLVSPKLSGQEAKYTAIAKFAGVSTAKLALSKADSGVKFTAPGLPSAKTDLLVIEIYEGETLRFIAKKSKLELAAPSSKANTVKVDDCLILAAPWDGTKSEGSCNWDIEEAK